MQFSVRLKYPVALEKRKDTNTLASAYASSLKGPGVGPTSLSQYLLDYVCVVCGQRRCSLLFRPVQMVVPPRSHAFAVPQTVSLWVYGLVLVLKKK